MEQAANDTRMHMMLHRIVDIEFSARVFDHDYWPDVYAESMTLKDGTSVSQEDMDYIQDHFECWFFEKYRNWLY